jgi:hypothetical protein
VQYDLLKSKVVEFSVKNEPWVKYKLEDRTIFFVKFVLIKVFRTSEYDASGQPIYAWNSQNVLTTISTEESRAAPSNPLPISTNAADYHVTPVDFERVGPEQWNVYELSDGALLRIKPEVVSVVRTDKYTADGEPFYILSTNPINRIRVPANLLRKQAPVTQKEEIYR